MERPDARVRLVVIQATSLCNLNCRYCYVPDRINATVMDDRTLEAAIAKVLRSPLADEQIEFLWHAGEPLVVGRPFYERATELIKRHNHRRLEVQQTIQTNGTLLDPDWCRFLLAEGFNVGVSIDGPAWLHDAQRPNWSGRGSHAKAMQGVALLREFGIPFGALCVLTAKSLEVPDELYGFFSTAGFDWLGFNVEEAEGVHLASSLAAAAMEASYRRFIDRLFDLWRQDANRFVIREFRDTLAIVERKRADPLAVRRPAETRPMNTITIRRNGAISTGAPEFASTRDPQFNDFDFGNINDIELDEVLRDPHYRDFERAINASVQGCADSCAFFDLCGGGYLSNKHAEHGRLQATETLTCRLHRQAVTSMVLEKLGRPATMAG